MSAFSVILGEEGSARARVAGRRHVHLSPQTSHVKLSLSFEAPVPPRVVPPHFGQSGVYGGGAGAHRTRAPSALWYDTGMSSCVRWLLLSESYLNVCWAPRWGAGSTTLAVYHSALSAHQMAILCPFRRACATPGAARTVVFPCSILRRRFHLACVIRHV